MKFLIQIFLVFVAAGLNAQDFFYISWNPQIPTSETQWISDAATSSFKVGYRAFPGNSNRFSIGVDVNATTFAQYLPTETFVSGNNTLTTDYFNYIYQYGFTASGQYYWPLGEGEHFFPYAGIGLGANFNEYTRYYNIYDETDNNWGFLVRPEVGMLVRFGGRRAPGILAGVHYDWSTNRSEQFNYENFSALGFQLGVVLFNR